MLTKSAIEHYDVIGIPLHASQIESTMPINVLTGDGVNPTGTSLISYPIKIEGESILVALPEREKKS